MNALSAANTFVVCPVDGCTYKTDRSNNLLRHQRGHTGDRPYRCTEPGCTYASVESGALRRHIRTHTGERPAVCDFPGCGFSCADQSNMGRHRQTHLTSRSYKCTFAGCGYAAKQRCTLKSHVLRKHNRVRRFACPHESCAYKGAHPGDLSSHIKRCRHIRAAAFAHTDELATCSGSVAASEGTPDIELLPPPEPQLPLHPAVAAMLSEMTAAAESLLPPPEPQLQPSAQATDSIAASDIELLPPPELQLQPSAQAVAAMLSEMTAAAESLARPALIAVAPQPAETVARTSAML